MYVLKSLLEGWLAPNDPPPLQPFSAMRSRIGRLNNIAAQLGHYMIYDPLNYIAECGTPAVSKIGCTSQHLSEEIVTMWQRCSVLQRAALSALDSIAFTLSLLWGVAMGRQALR